MSVTPAAQPTRNRPVDAPLWKQAVSTIMQNPAIAKQIADQYKALGGTWAAAQQAA
jgi:hypothetical protein